MSSTNIYMSSTNIYMPSTNIYMSSTNICMASTNVISKREITIYHIIVVFTNKHDMGKYAQIRITNWEGHYIIHPVINYQLILNCHIYVGISIRFVFLKRYFTICPMFFLNIFFCRGDHSLIFFD